MAETISQFNAEAHHHPERRRHPRYPIIDSSMIMVDLGSGGGGLMIDLSEGGMGVQTLTPVQNGAEMEFSFDLPDARKRIDGCGKVIWSNVGGGAGVQFTQLSEESRTEIRTWLGKLEAPKPMAPAGVPGFELVSESSTEVARTRHEIASRKLPADAAVKLIAARTTDLTAATGCALALGPADNMICRASLGDAPDEGVRIRPNSGLTGECITHNRVVQCDDTETDPRVDPVVCRGLNLRSAVVVPIVRAAEVGGVLEVFSSRPRAFSTSKVDLLKGMADLAGEVAYGTPARTAPVAAVPVAAPEPPEVAPSAPMPPKADLNAVLSGDFDVTAANIDDLLASLISDSRESGNGAGLSVIPAQPANGNSAVAPAKKEVSAQVPPASPKPAAKVEAKPEAKPESPKPAPAPKPAIESRPVVESKTVFPAKPPVTPPAAKPTAAAAPKPAPMVSKPVQPHIPTGASAAAKTAMAPIKPAEQLEVVSLADGPAKPVLNKPAAPPKRSEVEWKPAAELDDFARAETLPIQPSRIRIMTIAAAVLLVLIVAVWSIFFRQVKKSVTTTPAAAPAQPAVTAAAPAVSSPVVDTGNSSSDSGKSSKSDKSSRKRDDRRSESKSSESKSDDRQESKPESKPSKSAEPIVLARSSAPAETAAAEAPGNVVFEQKASLPALSLPAVNSNPALAPVRSQGVTGGSLISRVNPIYPPMAKSLHLEGDVVLSARITKQGTVTNVRRISGNPVLATSAIDAVKQWKYEPFKLDGIAQERDTTVTLKFSLPR